MHSPVVMKVCAKVVRTGPMLNWKQVVKIWRHCHTRTYVHRVQFSLERKVLLQITDYVVGLGNNKFISMYLLFHFIVNFQENVDFCAFIVSYLQINYLIELE